MRLLQKKSQNIKWETTIDKKKVGHKRIRRVSIDEFYSIVTNDKNAFHKICMMLPKVIEDVISNSKDIAVPNDTVFKELKKSSDLNNISVSTAIYMLGFSSYYGFKNLDIDN